MENVKNHVMLDIETLGQGSNAVITSIAAVQFNPYTGERGSELVKDINLESSVQNGLNIEPGTLIWWLKQSEKAQKGLIKSCENGVSLTVGLRSLSSLFQQIVNSLPTYTIDNIYVWGRGPRFDMGILTNAYNKIGLPVPWNFRNELCVRTAEFFIPDIKKDTPKVDAIGHGSNSNGEHNPLKDCYYQIAYVSQTYKEISNFVKGRKILRNLVIDGEEKAIEKISKELQDFDRISLH